MKRYIFSIKSYTHNINTQICTDANSYFEALDKIKEILIIHNCPDPNPKIELINL